MHQREAVLQVRAVRVGGHHRAQHVGQARQEVGPQALHQAVQEGDDAQPQGPVVGGGLHLQIDLNLPRVMNHPRVGEGGEEEMHNLRAMTALVRRILLLGAAYI